MNIIAERFGLIIVSLSVPRAFYV